jgi:hypothetical protein
MLVLVDLHYYKMCSSIELDIRAVIATYESDRFVVDKSVTLFLKIVDNLHLFGFLPKCTFRLTVGTEMRLLRNDE